MVFDQTTGAHLDDHAVSAVADEMGFVHHAADGTQSMGVDGISGVLTQLGIPSHIATGSIPALTDALANGHSVIAAVDAEKIWGQTPDPNRADHAVEVTGIDAQDGVVFLNDPGIPGGEAEQVPLSVFESAWADSGHQMVVTDGSAATIFDSGVEAPSSSATAEADGMGAAHSAVGSIQAAAGSHSVHQPGAGAIFLPIRLVAEPINTSERP
jgi:hypothetical protein